MVVAKLRRQKTLNFKNGLRLSSVRMLVRMALSASGFRLLKDCWNSSGKELSVLFSVESSKNKELLCCQVAARYSFYCFYLRYSTVLRAESRKLRASIHCWHPFFFIFILSL